jgi:lysophospholipase L1-like esterase
MLVLGSASVARRLATWRRLLFVLLVATAANHCSDPPVAPTPPTPPPPIPTLEVSCPASQQVQAPDWNPITVIYASPTTAGGLAPVTTACTPASGSAFNPGTTSVGCTATDSRTVTATCAFTVSVQVPPRLTYTRFVAFGDSITWGRDSEPLPSSAWVPFAYPEPPPSFAYPAQLQGQLAARYTLQTPVVINEGWPGETAQEAPSRFSQVLVYHRPEAVLLMEGTNDLWGGDIGIQRAIAALRLMIQDAKSAGVRVALATVAPQRNSVRPVTGPYVPDFNEHVRALAAAENVPLVDVYDRMKTDMALIGKDGLHPTVDGFGVMTRVFFDAVVRSFEDKPPAAAGIR